MSSPRLANPLSAEESRLRPTLLPGLLAAVTRNVSRGLADVAVYERGASLWHTHSPRPMAEILDALPQEGEPPPDLVIADHGWAGCAADRGIDTIGYADSNDPALFLGEAEGTLTVCVPLDDYVTSVVSAFLAHRKEDEPFADWVARADEELLRGESLDRLDHQVAAHV